MLNAKHRRKLVMASTSRPTMLRIAFLLVVVLLRKQWTMVGDPSPRRNTTITMKAMSDDTDPLAGPLRQPANAPANDDERTSTIDPKQSGRNAAAVLDSSVTDGPANKDERTLDTDLMNEQSDQNATTILGSSIKNGVSSTRKDDEEQKAMDDRRESFIDTSNIKIKVRYPVFVASLYKSGTTTIHAYFECGKQKSVHYAAGRQRTGPCLQRRIEKRLHPVFQGCGGDTFDIYTDNANLNAPRSCFDPSVHGLDAIYESYPNGTILMAVRDSQKWLDSVDRYRFRNWALLEHLMQCRDLWTTQQQDVGNRTLTRDDILKFYDWHTEHVRSFAAAHPSMTYIEVKLESEDAAQILEDRIGIPAQCWGHSNINTKHTSQETVSSTQESV